MNDRDETQATGLAAAVCENNNDSYSIDNRWSSRPLRCGGGDMDARQTWHGIDCSEHAALTSACTQITPEPDARGAAIPHIHLGSLQRLASSKSRRLIEPDREFINPQGDGGAPELFAELERLGLPGGAFMARTATLRLEHAARRSTPLRCKPWRR